MKKSELLQQLNDSLDEYKKLQGFIDKAKAQAGKFSDAVIQKVCLDNQVKSMEVADQVVPHLPEVQTHVAELQGKIDTIESDRSTSGDALEELNLRKAIGEMTDKEFDAEATDLQKDVDGADSQIAEIREELDGFEEVLARWQELSGEELSGEELSGEELAAEGAGEEDLEAGADDQADLGDPPGAGQMFSMGNDEEGKALLTDPELAFGGRPSRDDTHILVDEDSVVPGEGEGPLMSEEIRVAQAEFGAQDDVIVEDGEPEDGEPEDGEPEDGEPENGEPEVVAGGVEESEEPVVVEVEGAEDGDAESAELEIEDAESAPAGVESAEVDSVEASGENGADEDGRRALLLYQEGTAEEQVYPFTGDELTIGRGRDNDIQIKNDSKVSRRHCRLFRKEGAFYMQDNKSSNGSLVNGELITERRLFGGEELIVGETFFRFRIMD